MLTDKNGNLHVFDPSTTKATKKKIACGEKLQFIPNGVQEASADELAEDALNRWARGGWEDHETHLLLRRMQGMRSLLDKGKDRVEDSDSDSTPQFGGEDEDDEDHARSASAAGASAGGEDDARSASGTEKTVVSEIW